MERDAQLGRSAPQHWCWESPGQTPGRATPLGNSQKCLMTLTASLGNFQKYKKCRNFWLLFGRRVRFLLGQPKERLLSTMDIMLNCHQCHCFPLILTRFPLSRYHPCQLCINRVKNTNVLPRSPPSTTQVCSWVLTNPFT